MSPRVEIQFDGVSRGARRAGDETRRAIQSVGTTAKRESRTLALFGTAVRRSMLAIGAGVAAAAAGSVFALKRSVDAAVNLGEQINKARVVFRGAEADVLRWSENTARSIGISQRAALEFAGTFGNMLVPMGFARREAAQMSTQLVNLAADMASFNNASPEETLEALRAGLAGETEPLRRFGVFLNEARVRQEALNAGLISGKQELTAAGKAAAIYRIILKDTGDAQGDFQRTSGSLANQQRTLRALFEDVAARIGKALTPALESAAGAMSRWLGDRRNQRAIEELAGTIGNALIANIRDLVGWVDDNRDGIRSFFEGAAEAAQGLADALFTIATAANDVAEQIGGWDNAFKLILSGVLAARLARVAAALGSGKFGGGLGILGSARALARMAPIALAVYLALNTDEFEEKISSLNRWLNNVEPLRDLLTSIGLWNEVQGHAERVDAATKTPQGTVADPRGGTIGAPLAPSAPGGTGGVSYSGGVTPPKAHVIAFVKRVSAIYGSPLNVMSGVRPGSRVVDTGKPSMHGTGDAADIGPYYGKTLTAIGQAALVAAGMSPDLAYRQTKFVGTVNGVNILFNTMVGGNHYNHVHVGLRGAPPAVAKDKPQTVSGGTEVPDYTPTGTGATTGQDRAGGAAAATIDRRDLAAARGTARFISRHLESIASPQVRARLRQRALALMDVLAETTDPKEFARVKRNLAALERDFEKAVELGNATKAAKASAREIGAALARMPEDTQRELRPKLERLRRELGNVTSQRQLDRIKSDLEKIREAIAAAIERMERTVERRRDAFGAAFGKLADKALRVFDAKTDALIEAAAAKVDDLDARLREKTPAELELEALRAEREAADRERSRAEALAGAETPEDRARLEAQFRLGDRERELEERARLEREALEREVELERERRQKAAEAEQARIRDERELMRERFENRYREIEEAFRNEEISADEAQKRLLALLGEYGVSYAEAGALVGAAFAEGFRAALSDVAKAVDELREAVNELRSATGLATVGGGAGGGAAETAAERALRIRSEARNRFYGIGGAAGGGGTMMPMQRGGRVPGPRHVRRDSVPLLAAPGEEVLDRSLSEALRRELVSGGLSSGGRFAGATFYVLGTTEREVARALARIVEGAPATASYDAPIG